MVLKDVHIERFKGIEDVHLQSLGTINALYGRNNSGKSTILHALDMAGLALTTRTWTQFQPKLEVKDLFQETGPFQLTLTYSNGSRVIARQRQGGIEPTFEPEPTEEQRFRSVYIVPDPGIGLARREHRTPRNIMSWLENRDFAHVNGMELLFALKFYAGRGQRGFRGEDYQQMVDDVRRFFPEIERLDSDRTEDDVATLTY